MRLFLPLVFVILSFLTVPVSVYAIPPDGLGQAHSIGNLFDKVPGMNWAYSSGLPFAFQDGQGDHWAAIETRKGIFNFSQIEGQVSYVKSRGKKMWLNLQAFDRHNKEHNIPKWALDEGLETFQNYCGDQSVNQNWRTYNFSDVASVWNNPKYIDQAESVRFNDNGVEKVKTKVKIPAVWDPKFLEYYSRLLAAAKQKFNPELASNNPEGAITAINLMSGGIFGESVLPALKYPWDCYNESDNCTADVENPDCPAIQSMARVKNLPASVIASRSNCDPANVVPGNTVHLCTEAIPANCPKGERGAYCYVFEDYFIQAVKLLVTKQVEIFDGLPIVWQTGSGITGTGRSGKILQDWMNKTYGSRIYFKFNGWGPRYHKENSSNWQRDYGSSTRHGYECYTPTSFSRDYWKTAANAQRWCDEITTGKPGACTSSPINGEEVGRLAIAEAIRKGMVEDKSSYLAMQGEFFAEPVSQTPNGKTANKFYFNPNDNTNDCTNSEINVADYGVGFCPGFLNYVFANSGSPGPLPTLPASTPLPTQAAYPSSTPAITATSTPASEKTPTPTIPDSPSPTHDYTCITCPSGVPSHSQGNADCNESVNGDDLIIWQTAYMSVLYGNADPQNLNRADFDCQEQGPKEVDLVDYEIWRRNGY